MWRESDFWVRALTSRDGGGTGTAAGLGRRRDWDGGGAGTAAS